jgi:hypothetical protein
VRKIICGATSKTIAATLCFLAGTALAQSTPQQNVPEANPARPTVANPATLTPVGYLQFETGALGAQDSPEFSTRKEFNEVIKLTVHPRLQFLLASEPLVRTSVAGRRAEGFGDAFVGVQAVVLPGAKDRPTVALSYIRQVRDGGLPDFDSGSALNSMVLLVSGDAAGFHVDINGMFNEVVDQKLRRAQFGQTISISHPLKKITIAGELWHFTQPLRAGNAVGNLWAVSYPVRKNLVVDGGFDHGLTSSSTRWEVFFGFTYLLPHRLWH